MTEERQLYFIEQLSFEEKNFTKLAKEAGDKLISEKSAFVSYQTLRYAVDNYLDILRATNLQFKRFDFTSSNGYANFADNFVNQFTSSPQKIEKDNCSIALVSTVGIEAKWKYAFNNVDHRYMKAEGEFNFAHDLKHKIDIVQIPLLNREMILTIVAPRQRLHYYNAERLFHLAFRGAFYFKVRSILIPKFAFSVLLKEYSTNGDPVSIVDLLVAIYERNEYL